MTKKKVETVKTKGKAAKFLNKADRRAIVERLLLAHLSPAGIAEQLKVSRTTIETDAAEITAKWAEKLDLDAETLWAIRSKRAYSELCLQLGQDGDIPAPQRQGWIATGIRLQGEYETLLDLQERARQSAPPSALEKIGEMFADQYRIPLENTRAWLEDQGWSKEEIKRIEDGKHPDPLVDANE